MKDLDNVLQEQSATHIKTKDDFADYHRRFKTITVHLIGSGKLTELEERKCYPQGVEERFRNHIYRRLQILQPQHSPDDAYNIADFTAAANFILDGPAIPEIGDETAAIKRQMIITYSTQSTWPPPRQRRLFPMGPLHAEAYKELRKDLGPDDAGAIAKLTAGWVKDNDQLKVQWAAQEDADKAVQEAEDVQRQLEAEKAAAEAEKLAEEERLEAEKKKPKLGDFDVNSAPSSFVETRISLYAKAMNLYPAGMRLQRLAPPSARAVQWLVYPSGFPSKSRSTWREWLQIPLNPLLGSSATTTLTCLANTVVPAAASASIGSGCSLVGSGWCIPLKIRA
ncbi:hypothetical protein B0H11DRAFT_2299031 [Mycena galericulata]|nr:hypothetical protein B0H11DRAFT_2299031 [Mycena galericulata]